MKSIRYQKTPFGFAMMLFLLFSVTMLFAGSVTVSWDPNSESDLSGYKIYYGTNSRNYSGLVDVGNVTSYQIHNLEDGKTYFFAVTAYDFSGNESGFSDEVTANIGSSDGNTDNIPPKLVAVAVMGETQIDVLFSEPLDRTSAQNSLNYSISNGIQVLGAVLNPNLATVHLITTVHERGKSYVLSVSNVQDQNGNTIAAGSSKSYDLPNPSQDTEPPELVYVVILDTTHLDVIFSERLDKNSAQNSSNYSINNGIQVLEAVLDDNLLAVHLVTTAHERGQNYVLSVSNVQDQSGNPIAAGSSKSYNLPNPSQDTKPPELVYVVVLDSTHLDVVFNEPIEQSSAETVTNYSVDNNVRVLEAHLKDNQTVVQLTTTAHQGDVTYTLTVNNVRDLSLNPNEIQPNSEITYTYSSNDDSPQDPPDTGENTPSSFVLFQNHPNPFNPETEIRFFLDKARDVDLKVYNTLGQLVKSLIKNEMPPGFHTVVWDGTNNDGVQLPSGIYIYTLEVKRNVLKGDLLVNVSLDRRVKKMTLIR